MNRHDVHVCSMCKIPHTSNRTYRRRSGSFWAYCKTCSRKRAICTRLKIEVAIFEALEAEQQGRCGICGKLAALNLDHNHQTGKVRKFLCNSCNITLGFVERGRIIAGDPAPFINYLALME